MTTPAVAPAAPPAQETPNAGAEAGKNTSTDAAAAQKAAADTATAPAKADPAAAEKAKTDQAAADKAKADEAAKAKTAAEVKYELKLQEGSLLTAERDVAEVTELAKSKGLAPEVAQVLLDQRHVAVKSFFEGQQKTVDEMKGQWKAENSKRHGDKLTAVETEVQALVTKHGPAGLWEKLNGFGLEPDVLQLLANIAAQGRNDEFVSGRSIQTPDLPADPVQRLRYFEEQKEKSRGR